MTDLTCTINLHDYKAYVQKGEYYTDMIPVTIKRTDLNGVDHTIVVRHKGYFAVTINPLSPAKAEDLMADLMASPVSVTYYSFQEKKDVTKTMTAKFDALQDAKKRSSGHWVRSFKIQFTEE